MYEGLNLEPVDCKSIALICHPQFKFILKLRLDK